VIYCGCAGIVYTLSPTDGELVGTNSLKATGYQPISQLWVGEQLIISTGRHIMKLDVSGNELWKHEWREFSHFNCTNLQLLDNQLWAGNGTDLLRVDLATGAISSRWKLPAPHTVQIAFLNFIQIGDFFYVNTQGHLYKIDRITGGVVWKDGLEGLGYCAHLLSSYDQSVDFNKGNLFVFEKALSERSY